MVENCFKVFEVGYATEANADVRTELEADWAAEPGSSRYEVEHGASLLRDGNDADLRLFERRLSSPLTSPPPPYIPPPYSRSIQIRRCQCMLRQSFHLFSVCDARYFLTGAIFLLFFLVFS